MNSIVFDMDGVLFDTEKLYERFWIEAASSFGYNMTFDDVASIRSTDAKLAELILKNRIATDFPYNEIKNLRIKLMSEYTDSNGVETKVGVNELLIYLKDNNYNIGLATTSNLSRATSFLKFGNIYDYFDVIVTGDMVSHCKPDPEIYLTTMKRLGTVADMCYAVEDSFNGVRAAYNANMTVLMVPDRDVPISEMYEKAIVLDDCHKIIEYLRLKKA